MNNYKEDPDWEDPSMLALPTPLDIFSEAEIRPPLLHITGLFHVSDEYDSPPPPLLKIDAPILGLVAYIGEQVGYPENFYQQLADYVVNFNSALPVSPLFNESMGTAKMKYKPKRSRKKKTKKKRKKKKSKKR